MLVLMPVGVAERVEPPSYTPACLPRTWSTAQPSVLSSHRKVSLYSGSGMSVSLSLLNQSQVVLSQS